MLISLLTESSIQQYEQVLRQAKDLLMKYKNLSLESNPVNEIVDASSIIKNKPSIVSSTDLNKNTVILSFFYFTFKHNIPYQVLKEMPKDEILKDIVVGMAQDTDPKNFVVFCGSLRK